MSIRLSLWYIGSADWISKLSELSKLKVFMIQVKFMVYIGSVDVKADLSRLLTSKLKNIKFYDLHSDCISAS